MFVATWKLQKLLLLISFVFISYSCHKSDTPKKAVVSPSIDSKYTSELSHLSCDGKAKDVLLEYDADFVIAASAAPKNEDGSLNENFWKNTLYYGSMHIPFNFSEVNRDSGSKFMAMYPETVRWGEIQTSETTYPYDVNDIFMSEERIGYYPQLMADYYRNIKKTPIKKGEKAIRIMAKVSFRALFCNKTSAPSLESDNFEFFVPVDPQTVFEVVPYGDWLPIKDPIRRDRAKTNPCVSTDVVAVSPDQPAPTNGDFHYFWYPTLKSVDDDGNSFDCSKWYEEGVSFRRIKPRFFENSSPSKIAIPYKELSQLKRPIEISIVSGVQRQTYKKFDSKWLIPAIEKALTVKSAQEHKALLPGLSRPREEDLSVDKLLIILWRLALNIQLKEKSIIVEQDYIEITLEGRLKHSELDAKINIILGNSKNSHEAYPRFAGTVGELIVRSDIFLYEGHSGFGQSLSPDALGIEKVAASIPIEKIPKYQLMGFFSCQSLFHYHPGKFKSLPRISKRIWVDTLGDYVDVNGNGSLGIIASLEQYAKTGKSVPFDRWANDFANDNFMMLLEDSSAN